MHQKSAFIPFSFGPSDCVGKTLARDEMMMVVSALMQRFDFEFSDGFHSKGWPKTVRDYFVTVRGSLHVKLRARA